MYKTGDNVFTSFLHLLQVKHTRKFSNQYFNEHPHKYNLFGLSKMLSDYGIENAGTKIPDKETDLYAIELPFIAQVGNEFVIVHTIDTDKVHYLWNGKKTSIPVADFLQAWTGIILLAEPNSNSIEPEYKEHKKKELLNSIQNYLLLFSGSLLLVLACIKNSLFTNLNLSLLIILNSLGIYVCYLLVQKQLHIHSKYADKICSLFHQSDCNNVLETKAAKLWGVFGWSEIGLGYFSANILLLLFLPYTVSLLAIVNILTLPYSFWSVWYQKFQAKQWCPLCLIVQILLWLIFILNCLFGYIRLPDLHSPDCWSDVLFMGCVYAILIFSLNILIPVLSKNRMVESLKQEINSLKANEDVFKVFLKTQPYFEVNKADSQILFGNPNAGLRITILTNPYCNPCAGMHKRVEKFLQDTNNTVCVQYIFSSFDPSLDFANKYLIAAYIEYYKASFKQIICDWFEKGKPLEADFFKDLHLNIDNPVVEAEFQKHESWKARTQLRATPTILVNGYQLPDNYKIEDLRYFTELAIDVD
ncbi:MAG: thioredoxin domain-containing protein [Candidatus Symbiothrix sp.]|jgi:hypothetical protein|nr:thioredoxin domain-containing protein [Candidatus Symbiothrix sp.]